MKKKVYGVIANGYHNGYGAELYLVGIFSNKKQADEVKEKYADDCFTTEVEVELNKEYPMIFIDEYYGHSNDNYIGGYIE